MDRNPGLPGPGVARYLDVAGSRVLPIGLTGSEHLFPVGDPTVHPARVVMHIGRPIRSQALRERAGGDRRLMVDAIGLAVADLLPPEYRGICADRDRYAKAADVLLDARQGAK